MTFPAKSKSAITVTHAPQTLPLYTAERLKAQVSPMKRKIKPTAGSKRLIQGRTWEIARGGCKK
jgi:hypothetical protein